MSFPYNIDLFANNKWNDITDFAYGHDRADVHIVASRTSESSSWQPSSCEMELNNRDGRFSPYKADGPFYGGLGVNTQIRITRDLITATFPNNVANAWATTDTGEAFTTFGAGGVLNASDYNTSGGNSTHSVPAANAYRSTYLASVSMGDVDFQTDLNLNTTDITGAQVAWGVIWRGQSTSDYWRVAVEVQTNESVLVSLYNDSGSLLSSATVTGVTHASSQTLRLRVNIDREYVRAKVWVPVITSDPLSSGEPYGWQLDSYLEIVDTSPGWIGLQSKVDTSNSNAKPLIFSYSNIFVRSDRFFGEVSDWPNSWDTTGRDVYVNVTASSIMRRVGNSNPPIKSPVRSLVESVKATLDAAFPTSINMLTYVPIEEGPQALIGAPEFGPYQVVLNGNTRAPSEHWGKGDFTSWLYPGIALYGDGQLACAINQTKFIPSDGWRMDMVCKNNADVDWYWRIETGTFTWVITFKPSSKGIEVTQPTGSSGTSIIPQFFDNATHNLRFSAHQSGGAIIWSLAVDGVDYMVGTPTATLQQMSHWRIDSSAAHTGPIAIGHTTCWGLDFGSSDDFEDAVTGYRYETSIFRMQRLANDGGVLVLSNGSRVLSAQLGPQSLAPLGQQLDEAEKTDMGLFCDLRPVMGLGYRPLHSLINQTSRCTLSYTNKQLVTALRFINDDQYLKNDFTATNQGGGSFRYTKTSGPLSTKDPNSGGVQTISDQQSYQVASDSQLQDIATWQVNLGTVDEPRISEVCVNLAKSTIDRATLFRLMELQVGDVFTLQDIPLSKGLGGTSTRQIILGYEEIINGFSQEMRFHPVPESPYQIIRFDDSDVSRTQASNSFLATSISNSATSLSIKSLDGTRWTKAAADLPIPIRIGGEDMSATAVTDNVPSFIAAGTAAHADNAGVTPGLPAGSTTGDLMIVFAAIRNTGATLNTPGGYALFHSVGHIQFFVKVHTGSEVAPTITPSGGAAGDTVSAQMATFRNIGFASTNTFTQTNSSAQNIGYPVVSHIMVDGLVIVWGWKQDDWTSVNTIDNFGFTEIGEPSSTLGNDQGLVWNYKIFDTIAQVPDGAFVVTGGASAVSKGGALAFANWQTFTVTRSVNGVVKGHTADGSERCRVRSRGRTRVGLQRVVIF